MMLKKILPLLLLSVAVFSQSPLPLIPQPQSAAIKSGYFILSNDTKLAFPHNSFEERFLKDYLQKQYGLRISDTPHFPNPGTVIEMDIIPQDTIADKNGSYRLVVSEHSIKITAPDSNGIFYGIQTLLQLLPPRKSKKLKIPCIEISDAPQYKWRGMHLDVSRHFFPVAFIKRYIDYMAMYKMNTFHWHLTDDQGWRIEIKKYPELTRIGAWRNGSMVGHYNGHIYDNKRYGGFYSQQEIKEVVAYAAQRHITIVPEIDMPGHAQAILAAYPALSCTGGPFEVAKQWDILEDVLCPKEETFAFLEGVLTEVMDMFPSQYIHIGGDECPKTRWKACPHCQALIKEKGLKDEHALQGYFIARIGKFLNSHGRKIIGWDEILEESLDTAAAVMSWQGTEGGIKAAGQGHNVVMTPGSHCYFDQYQADPKTEPLAIGGLTTVEKVYSFKPFPEGLPDGNKKYILGAQGNVWTEYMATPEKVEYMVMPRMAALAEVVWGKAGSAGYDDFRQRLLKHLPLLDFLRINYCKAVVSQQPSSPLGQH